MNKKRILLVDDEYQLVSMMRLRLEVNNYEVITAYDGDEGLEKARNEKPDLIILDIMLPKRDGYEVCETLKSDPKFKDIPIIIFSAKAQQDDVKAGVEKGADMYITKPFDPKDLLEAIAKLLSK